MVYISKPLGRNAFGDKHDIAAIQAALKNIKIRNKPIWPGRIDGRKTKDLEEAIAIFQAAHRIKITGKVEPRGPTITAMTRALPRSHAGLRGLKGTCIVVAATMGAREADQEARNTQTKAPFPDKEARALAAIQIKAGRELGICLERKRDFVTREGRFATELAPMGLKWIDPSSGRLATLNNPPREAIAAMLRVIPSSTEWKAGAAGKLECHSTRLVPALNGVGQPTAADYEALNLPQKTENEVWGAFIAAAARLVGDTTPQGPRNLDDLVQLAFQAVPPLGKQLMAVQKDDRFGFTNDARRDIQAGLTTLMPFLDRAIASLTGSLSADIESRLRIYFPPDTSRPAEPISDIRKIARDVRSNLQSAKVFLGQSFDTLFVAFPGPKADSGVSAFFAQNPDAIAAQGGGVIFIRQTKFGVFVQTPLQAARVLMHEGMHPVLSSEHEDERYLEQGVKGLATFIAPNNADSYTAFVLHGNIEAAKITGKPVRQLFP